MNDKFVDIRIDCLTDCLVERKTRKEVATTVKRIIPKEGEFLDWAFDWTIPEKDGETVYALFVDASNDVQGLVSLKPSFGGMFIGVVESAPHNRGLQGRYEGVGAHLFAIACEKALENDMDYVFFNAKSDLIRYYSETLGAKQIGKSQRMLIEGEEFLRLVEKYFKKG